ncbi:hypothetical protein TIFTF001_017634 [Ficus carica]|uniref:Uncharacterized protein n=1 Tax=Ficus carica TaxID=3494 RepID=A0AA88DJ26_FICCA|nr:hypothetical protein TIFTF001_017634 [Ficus carica]
MSSKASQPKAFQAILFAMEQVMREHRLILNLISFLIPMLNGRGLKEILDGGLKESNLGYNSKVLVITLGLANLIWGSEMGPRQPLSNSTHCLN